MPKKVINVSIALLFFILAGIFCVTGYSDRAGAEAVEPGSEYDPVVTRSFIIQYFTEEINRFMDSTVKPFVGQYVDRNVQWEVSNLTAGQVLVGQAGAEIIVRSGQAVVVDPTPNGIPDLTAGADIKAGSAVALNHLLVIPRSDGRGIKAQGSVWVMYRGQVSIQ